MRQHILLFVNGQQHRVTGADVFLTLSDFLRNRLSMCGTKIVCSEGDCGSCSLLCADLGPVMTGKEDVPEYKSIDSCIRFVYQLDGCHIVTVEGLACGGKLTGVQQAMIDCHGSQCGFCTPGFVMAMTGILEENDSPSEDDWRHGLTGNLCRCTGYSPIVEAGKKSNPANTQRMNSRYPVSELLKSLDPCADESLEPIKITAPNYFDPAIQNVVFCPTTIAQAVDFLESNSNARIVAGATDVGVQFNKGYCNEQSVWLDLNRVEELTALAVDSNYISAGARATWSDFENLTRELVPSFHHIVSIFGSPQIRNVGTIGGNIINASPIADSIPFLLVCETELELTSVSGKRTVNINDFYKDYKKFDLHPGELLTAIAIPLPSSESELRLYKVSRRRDLDISSFTAAIQIEFNQGTITNASIAFGAVGPTVLRLPKTEAFLNGKPFVIETMQAAGEIAITEITPISDVRGGTDFRMQLARNVFSKFFHEVKTEGAIA
ncbi:MAG: xanthine dehydrogenase small subunit [Mariniblastus sp.]